MSGVSPGQSIIIPRKEGARKQLPSGGVLSREAAARMRHIVEAISAGRPAAEVVEMTMTAIDDLYGLIGMFLEVRAEDLMHALRFVVYGYPPDKAQAIIDTVAADYFPKDLTSRIMIDKHRISHSAYLVPAEDWQKLAEEDPWADHPAYYLYPENARAPRRSPDEFHESDFYRFPITANGDEFLGYLDVYYSFDDRRPSQETVEAVELLVSLIGLVLKRERLWLQRERAPAVIAQRTDLLEDVLKIASSIISERDLTKLSDMILASVSSLFGFGKATLVVYDEVDGAFRWKSVFGYPDHAAREAKQRTIPTDVILDDLKEGRRIGKAAFFTPAEEMTPAQRSHFVVPRSIKPENVPTPRMKGEFRESDALAFSLHDSTGRIVGVIYPSQPSGGMLPDSATIETMEIFTSLAEVAIENARLTVEREQALRLSNQRTEQLSRILDITTRTMYVRDMDRMLEDLLKTLSQLLGIKRMVIGVKDEQQGVYKVAAVHGYSAAAAEKIRKREYPVYHVDAMLNVGASQTAYAGGAVKWRNKVGRMTYYMPAEGQSIQPGDTAYYPDPDLAKLPRRGKGHWHELDYMDTFVFDRSGSPIAYLEILKPRDERVPDSDTIEIIEIFASLAGIAIENARMFQDHIDSRRDAELYTDVLSHDIKNFNQAILGYLEMLKIKVEKPEHIVLIDKIAEQIMNTSRLSTNVRTMSRLTFGDVELVRTDIGAVLLDCQKSLEQYYQNRRIVFRHSIDRGLYFVNADELVREMFINLLTNAVKYDPHETVEIELGIERRYEGDESHIVVSVADHGQGISPDTKEIIFERFSKAPRKKGSGLGLHIVRTLATRYGGEVSVEDRVPGDHTHGTVFKVRLPAAA